MVYECMHVCTNACIVCYCACVCVHVCVSVYVLVILDMFENVLKLSVYAIILHDIHTERQQTEAHTFYTELTQYWVYCTCRPLCESVSRWDCHRQMGNDPQSA